jgi:DNA-binding CsgD family transcriptional regulator
LIAERGSRGILFTGDAWSESAMHFSESSQLSHPVPMRDNTRREKMREESVAREPDLFGSRTDGSDDTRAPLRAFLEELEEGTALLEAHGVLAYQNRALKSLLSDEPEATALLETARRFGRHCIKAPPSHAHGESSTVRPNDLRVATTRGTYSVRAIPLPTGAKQRAEVLLIIRRMGIVLPSVASLRLQFRLTPREAEVALLLAKGASNAEVALALGVSVHTARHHGEHLFAKIGVHSRKAMALHLS